MEVARDGGKKEWRVIFNGNKVSVWHDDKVLKHYPDDNVLKMNSADNCTAPSMHIMILEYGISCSVMPDFVTPWTVAC